MPDSLLSIVAILGLLVGSGLALGLLNRSAFSARWLLIAAALMFVNDAALTRIYGVAPSLLPNADWNWQGKALALAITLIIAAHPAVTWRAVGLTLRQNPKGRPLTYLVAAGLVAVFAGLALTAPNEKTDFETLVFQLTMPGLDEEPFYRGVLLFALNEALRGRRRILGIELGWGAILSCFLFGLAHAFEVSHGAVSFDAMTMAVTALPAFLLVWLRERTGSLVLPVLLHNFANSASLLM